MECSIFPNKQTIGDTMEEVSNKKIGLIAGYEPNRISLYILLLTSGREDDLMEVLYKDMEQYKINPNNKGESNGN